MSRKYPWHVKNHQLRTTQSLHGCIVLQDPTFCVPPRLTRTTSFICIRHILPKIHQCTLGHKVIKMKIWFSDFTLSWQNSLYFQPGEAIFFNFLLKKCHTFMCPNMGTFGPFFAISGKNNRDFSNDLPETPLTQERRGWFFYCRFPTRSTQSGAKIKGGALV